MTREVWRQVIATAAHLCSHVTSGPAGPVVGARLFPVSEEGRPCRTRAFVAVACAFRACLPSLRAPRSLRAVVLVKCRYCTGWVLRGKGVRQREARFRPAAAKVC